MIRFLAFLLGKEYESCKGCEILKQQLAFTNERNKELENTLLAIVSPKPPSVPTENYSQPIALPTVMTFSKRRQALEERDRQAARIARESSLLGRPDNLTSPSIAKLEKELGIADEISQELEEAKEAE